MSFIKNMNRYFESKISKNHPKFIDPKLYTIIYTNNHSPHFPLTDKVCCRTLNLT